MAKQSKAASVAVNFRVPASVEATLSGLVDRMDAPTRVHVFRQALTHLDKIVATIEAGGRVEFVSQDGKRNTITAVL